DYQPARQYVNAESSGFTAANVREVRAQGLAESEAAVPGEALVFYSESFERFRQGVFELDCSSCGLSFALNQGEYRQLHDNQDWRLLAQEVMKNGYKLDLAYFYLAKAAQGLGYDEAAGIYFARAAALAAEADSTCAEGLLVTC